LVVEAVGWTERLLSCADLDAALRIKILFMRALMARHQFDYREAIRRYRELLAVYREAAEAKRVALTLLHLAGCLCTVGETDAAQESALESLAILERAGETYFIGHGHVVLGLAHLYAGRIADAEAHHREALTRFVGTESAVDIAVCLSNLATCALGRDDLDTAETLAQESIDHAETARILTVVSSSLCVLANVAIRRHDPHAARSRLRAAMSAAQELNDYERLAEIFEAGMRIAALESDASFATRSLAVAEALRTRCSAVRFRTEALAIAALEADLRERLGPSRFEAIRVAGSVMAFPDAQNVLRDFLADRKLVKLVRQ
jgi:tetratricopeptide (TPR) repeat protein